MVETSESPRRTIDLPQASLLAILTNWLVKPDNMFDIDIECKVTPTYLIDLVREIGQLGFTLQSIDFLTGAITLSKKGKDSVCINFKPSRRDNEMGWALWVRVNFADLIRVFGNNISSLKLFRYIHLQTIFSRDTYITNPKKMLLQKLKKHTDSQSCDIPDTKMPKLGRRNQIILWALQGKTVEVTLPSSQVFYLLQDVLKMRLGSMIKSIECEEDKITIIGEEFEWTVGVRLKGGEFVIVMDPKVALSIRQYINSWQIHNGHLAPQSKGLSLLWELFRRVGRETINF